MLLKPSQSLQLILAPNDDHFGGSPDSSINVVIEIEAQHTAGNIFYKTFYVLLCRVLKF